MQSSIPEDCILLYFPAKIRSYCNEILGISEESTPIIFNMPS